MKKVMAFGTFDMLHAGHRYFLEEAKKRGDYLIVVVARDKTVKEVKGRMPVHSEKSRAENVKQLRFVDDVVLGGRGKDKYRIVRKIRPDVICLGYDQKNFTGCLERKLKKMGIKCGVTRLKPYKPHEFKTKIIREKKGSND